MEFLRTCNTNAQAIGDFEAVAYQAFSVARNPARSSSRTLEWNASDDIRVAEAELRRGNHIVLQDASRPWLWLFRATTADQVGQPPLELPTVDDFLFNREQYGVVKALELEHRATRNPRNVPLSASTSSPVNARPQKGIQSAQQSQSGGQSVPLEQQPHDVVAIYGLFTSAVVALISFHLVKDYNVVALNHRTFVSSSVIPQDIGSHQSHRAAPLQLTNIDVLWASAGTLVVSTFSLHRLDISCLADVVSNDEQKRLIGKFIRVSPNGTLAKIISFSDPVDSTIEDGSQRASRKRPKISPLERGIERWKVSVRRWLSWKGYSIASLEKKNAWVRVQFPHTSSPATSNSAFIRPTREILWPRALCFHFGDAQSTLTAEEVPLQGADALTWFETPHSKGFMDPLDLAQQWFMGKSERDKLAEARRKAKKAEEDAARAKEENRNLFASSPINARPGMYGELQSVSGVYPTPPDGVVPGTVVSCGDTPSVSGVATNVILAPGDKNPAINLSGPLETQTDDTHGQPLTSPNLALQYDDYNADVNNDDLFEDMDEGNFEGGNGVTDADFNFFDDPDGDDIIMADAPNPQESETTFNEKVEEGIVSAAPETNVKEEPPDPMAALEFALASASANTEEETQAQAVGQASYKKEFSPSDWLQKPHDGLNTHTQAQTQAQTQATITQASTPPLSPRLIEMTLLPSPKDKTPKKQNWEHRDSVFDPLAFNRKMSISDAKYKEGRFGFASEKPKLASVKEDTRPKSLRDLPLMTRLRYAMGVASANNNLLTSPDALDSDESDTTDETSSESEDEANDPPFKPFPGNFIIPIKRKLPTEGVATPLSATSFAESYGADFGDLVGLQTDDSALVALEPTIWDWAIVDLPPPSEQPSNGTRWALPAFAPSFSSVPSTPTSQPDLSMNLIEEKPLSGKDNIAIAQIVTDQIASATLDIFQEDISTESLERKPSEAQWHRTVKAIFPKAISCSVANFAAVQDAFPDMSAQMKGQQRPPPRRPNENATALGHHMFQLNPPYVRVRRADTLWDLLPPAIPFWETLGLGPCSPPKNVVAFGIYPSSEALTPCVESFLTNMQLAYDSCKLGNHTRVDTVAEYTGGLVPCRISGSASTRTAFKALRDTCVQLSKALATKHAQMRDKDDSKIDAFVIYMIDPFQQASAIWELCSAFWSLFQSYQQGPLARSDQVQKPDLVLQVVPIKYIASFETPVILDASVYANLAREVYDRCPPSTPSEDRLPLNIYSAPSFQLDEPIPRNIQFKLIAEAPQDLMRENSYMHLGYAISLDGMWVTAAWSDTCGKSQTMVSYNLGQRPFSEIAKEIWQTTIEIMQVRRVTWRVCIAKAGIMEREELESWVFLVQCPTVLNLFTTLLTIDAEPHFKFTPPAPPPTASGATGQATPGSTPQAVVSPEQGLTPAATPVVETPADTANDTDARLVDLTDETWGIILAHRLHNSHSINEYRPALISGLLVKRGTSPDIPAPPSSPDPLPGPIITGVNILWMGAVSPTRAATSPFPPGSGDGVSPGGAGANAGSAQSPQEPRHNSLTWTPTPQARAAAENLLKEVLGQFRGLGTLARLRGVKGCRHGAVPWHVAVAMRSVKGLVKTLPS